MYFFIFRMTPSTNDRFHHHSEYMLSPSDQTATPNKRHWANNSDDFPPKHENDVNMILFGKSTQMNMNPIHPSKRSCMMTTYMEPTNPTDDHQWLMSCSPNTGYNFMSPDDHIDTNVNKRTWNGGNNNPTDAIGMNGMACANNGDSVLPLELDHKKQCYNAMDVKANELERDLLGLGTHSADTNLMQMQQPNSMDDSVFNQASTSSMSTNNTGISQPNGPNLNIAQKYVFCRFSFLFLHKTDFWNIIC